MPDLTESDALLAIASDATAPIIVRTAKNTISDDALTIALTDLVESTYPGYAPITLPDFGLTDEDDEEVGDVLSDDLVFSASDAIVDPEAITAIFITREPTGLDVELCKVVILETPFIMERPGQQFLCAARMTSVGLNAT